MAHKPKSTQGYTNSPNSSDSDSAAEQDPHEFDNFIVPDSEVSDPEETQIQHDIPPKKRPRTRRLKRKDSEDLELLQENLGVSTRVLAKSADDLEAKLFSAENEELETKEPQPSKRRKLVEISDSDDSDMIDDDVEEGEIPENSSSIKLAATIFGTEPDVSSKKVEVAREFFEPSELKEQYISNEDELIRETDIAERLQQRFKHREFPTEDEITYETEWLAQRMIVKKPTVDLEALKVKVTNFLALHRVEKYEVPFIARYKIHLLHPEIENDTELWELYKWDGEWGHFYSKKFKLSQIIHSAAKNSKKAFKGKILDQESKVLSSYGDPGEVPKYISELLIWSSPYDYMNEINDLQHYVDVHVYSHTELKDKNKKSLNLLIEARKHNLTEFVIKAGLSPAQTAENIQAKSSVHKPAKLSQKPQDLAFELLCDSYPEELKVINAACNLMKSELMSTPVFRQFVRDEYRKNARVFTYPSSKGKAVLDIFHPFYRVKHLGHGKPVDTFTDEIWIEITKCEREELITVEFRLPWSNFKEDRIINELKPFYLSATEDDDSDIDWNKFRNAVLRQAVEDLYILLEKEVRNELSAKAEEVILQKCCQGFFRMLSSPSFSKEDDEKLTGVMSIVTDSNSDRFGSTAVAWCDEYGEIIHSQVFKMLTARKAQELKSLDAEIFKEEKRSLEKIILERQPDIIVIGANSLAAVQIRRFIGSLVENLTVAAFNESSVDWPVDTKDLLPHIPVIVMADLEVPRLYSLSHRAKRFLKDLNYLQRQAVSLCRMTLNPLSEILGLWSDPNEIQIGSLNLHSLQKELSESRLLTSLEMVAMDICCERGIDINSIASHEHLKYSLPFICGLGPIKAHYLFESLRHKFKGKLSFRAQLIAKRVLTSRVYENCAGFIKIPYIERESDPLDQTRIHPEHYELAKRVVSSALEMNNEDKLDDMSIAQVMHNPSTMEDLDLDSYAAFLESKGKTNMKHFLEFIVRELSNPFHVSTAKYQEPIPEELLYLCSRETPVTLKVGSLVQGTVIDYEEDKRYLRCRLESGLEGTADSRSINDKKELTTEDVNRSYPKGASIKARVIEISARLADTKNLFFRVKISLLAEDLRSHGKLIKLDLDDSFITDESDWFEHAVMEDDVKLGKKYVPRVINHPKFKNISYKTACDELQNKDIGEYIFRPSSRGLDHLTCTWKFYDFVYSHLDVIEEGKPAPNMLGKKFRIGSDLFDSLQEIVERYIVPCEKLTKDAIVHSKFKDCLTGGVKFIYSLLQQEKSAMSGSIPYYLTIIPNYPQFIILIYLPRERVIEEFIKVKPKGLFFHEAYHPSITFLLSWFKRHFGDKVYQSQLSRSKPPLIDTTNHFAVPAQVESVSSEEVIDYDTVRTPRTGRETPARPQRTPYGDATPYTRTPHIGAQEWAGGRDLTKTPRADDWEMSRNYESFAVPATPRSERVPNRPANQTVTDAAQSDQKSPWERPSKINSTVPTSWGDQPSDNSWGNSNPTDDWTDEPKRTERGRDRGSRGRGRGGDTNPRACFKCGEQGHMSRECTKPGSGSGNRSCYNCGEEGHMSRECPKPSRGGRRGRGRGTRTRSDNQDSSMSGGWTGSETQNTGGWGGESNSTGGWGNDSNSAGGWTNSENQTGDSGWNKSSGPNSWGNSDSQTTSNSRVDTSSVSHNSGDWGGAGNTQSGELGWGDSSKTAEPSSWESASKPQVSSSNWSGNKDTSWGDESASIPVMPANEDGKSSSWGNSKSSTTARSESQKAAKPAESSWGDSNQASSWG